MTENGNSDPLPYTQVDRAVKPKAALLAGAVGISPQHAMGSLVEFWDLCGDPRELERLVADGKHEVMLTVPEVVNRFKLASGVMIDPSLLVSLGLLEHRGDVFRVRGMSRYFAPIESRVALREKARAGGLASAAARKAKNGTAQPEKSLPLGSGLARTLVEPAPNLNSTNSQSFEAGFEAGSSRVQPESNPPEAAYIVHRSATALLEEAPPSPKPIRPPPLPAAPVDKFADGESFWAHFQGKRHLVGLVPEKHPKASLSFWWSEVGMQLNGEYERLEEAMYRFADSKHWQKAEPPVPFGAFMSEWRSFVPQKRRA